MILAAKGIQSTLSKTHLDSRLDFLSAAILAAFLIVAPVGATTNLKQLSALSLVDRSIPEDACVYDNAGFAVTREHASYWYFTDELVRKLFMAKFEIEVPDEIQQKHCEAMILDERFGRLSNRLQSELKLIFPACEGLVCFRDSAKL